jgi:hypothetical protein
MQHKTSILNQYEKHHTQKRKKQLPIIALFLLLLIGLSLFYFFFYNASPTPIVTNIAQKKSPLKVASTNIPKKETLPIQPIPTIKVAKPTKVTTLTLDTNFKLHIPELTSVKMPAQKSTPKIEPLEKTANEIALKPQISASDISIKERIQQYLSNPNDTLALNIARSYMHTQNYHEAKRWCMRANEHNNDNIESWVLFSKIHIATGDFNSAKKTLAALLKKSTSAKIQDLYNSIP